MEFSTLFPTYPLQFISREKDKKGRKLKLRPTSPYVDVPAVVYSFIFSTSEEMLNRDITLNEFKRKWEDFLSNIGRELFINNKPFVKVLLIDKPSIGTRTLLVRVYWEEFFDYLEQKAKLFLIGIKNNGNINEVYNHIKGNYHSFLVGRVDLLRIKEEKLEQKYTRQFENFHKIIIYTGDYSEIQIYLETLLKIISNIEKNFERKNKAALFFTSQLKMDWYGLYLAFDINNIPACYFYLRNILEHIIKLLVYEKIAGEFEEKEVILEVLFRGDGIKIKPSYFKDMREFENWKKKIKIKLQKVVSRPPEEWEKGILKFREGLLGIRKNTLRTICQHLNILNNLENIWSVCSEVIHNQPPLPFYSLLEIKVFKHFMRYYVESLKEVFHLSYIQLPSYEKLPKREKEGRKLRKISRNILMDFSKELKKYILKIMKNKKYQKITFFKPLTLASIFLLWQPLFSRSYKQYITEDDLDRFIEKIEPLSFKVGLKEEKKTTLQIFYHELSNIIKNLSPEFAYLDEGEKKIVLFWILSELLPEILGERFKVSWV